MRHSFWIVNSSLLLLVTLSILFSFFSQQAIPHHISLDPITTKRPIAKTTTPIDIKKIYENDLFNTYHEKIEAPVEPDYTSALPQPPNESPISVPQIEKPEFSVPLELTLKGIMLVSDESNNSALIETNKTKEEKNYSVGDTIEDAQIIKILPNKIILIRSNGQQETLYLSENDAKSDISSLQEQDDWSHVVQKYTDAAYKLDPDAFAETVQNLARCIDMFDLTTVYKRGDSIGCRVGLIKSKALGTAMGFEQNDIITEINSMPVANTDERFAAYQHLVTLKHGDTVNVVFMRDDNKHSLTYDLFDLTRLGEVSTQEPHFMGIETEPTPEELQQERIQLLKEKHFFAPTAQELRIRQKMNMLKKGSQNQHKDSHQP